MIYVLSGDRRDTQAWAAANGLKLVEVKHVQNSGSLPGVMSAKHRIVKLSSYSKRRDHWSIDAKLRLINRRADLPIEEIEFDRLAPSVAELPLEEIYDNAVELDAEEDFSIEDGEPSPDAPETPDVAESDQEPAEQIEDELKQDEVVMAAPPADDKEKYPGVLEIGGVLPSPKFDPDTSKVSADVTSEVPEPETPAEEDSSEAKPKRKGRRSMAQIAYDEALVAWESDNGDVESVKAARANLKDGDERLNEDPTEPDLDF